MLTVAAVVGAAGCSDVRPPKFALRPPVTEIADDSPVPVPARNRMIRSVYLSDTYLRRPIVETLELKRVPRAGDVSSLDEVPDSSWYQSIAGGPANTAKLYASDGPPAEPIRLRHAARDIRSKRTVPVVDARGKRYLLVRDPDGAEATTTAAAAIASRLARAIGYLTPETWVVVPDSPPTPSFRRAAAVRWPPGEDLGPAPPSGMRRDDPNDRIAHRDRRTLRALAVVGAWLGARTLGPKNTLDVYEGPPGRGHVRHYLTGLDVWLGAWRSVTRDDDYAVGEIRGGLLENLVTLGLLPDTREQAASLAVFPRHVDAATYAPRHPYEPVTRARPDDNYWAAKRLLEVPIATIRWAVEAGKLRDRSLRRRLVDVLVSRRRDVVRYWLSQVSPCEPVRVSSRALVLEDVALRAGLAGNPPTRYLVAFLDESGEELGSGINVSVGGPRFTVRLPRRAARSEYVVVRARAARRQTAAPRSAEIHLARDRSRSFRVVGVTH